MEKGSIVSVFGGSAARPGEEAWVASESVGRQLAEAGYAVMTGGFNGVMEAASKGAKEAGGHVIGVTFRLNKPGETEHGANPFVMEEITYSELSPRLLHLVKKSDAVVVMPGGVGTLSEAVLTWSLIQVGEISPRPFILYGPEWGKLFSDFEQMYNPKNFMRGRDMRLWKTAHTPEDVITMLRTWH